MERKVWTKVREEVESSGFGGMRVLSTGHTSGERLKQLTGVAAILRFPMEELIESDLPNPPDYKKWLEELVLMIRKIGMNSVVLYRTSITNLYACSFISKCFYKGICC